MANLEIAQIQNAALKAAALEVDESGKKDGYIDSSEINLFTDKATALLNEKKCTAQEFATLFVTNDVDKTNTTDVFTKVDSLDNTKNTPEALAKDVDKTNPTDVFAEVDSLHNAKNTPEALAKDAEEAKRAEKQEKIKEIKTKIAKNDAKLKLYKVRLAQKKISFEDYQKELTYINETWTTLLGISWFGGATTVGAFFECLDRTFCIAGVITALSFAGCIGTGIYQHSQKSKEDSPKKQEEWRNAYKEAYLKVSQENEQLKAHLAIL